MRKIALIVGIVGVLTASFAFADTGNVITVYPTSSNNTDNMLIQPEGSDCVITWSAYLYSGDGNTLLNAQPYPATAYTLCTGNSGSSLAGDVGDSGFTQTTSGTYIFIAAQSDQGTSSSTDCTGLTASQCETAITGNAFLWNEQTLTVTGGACNGSGLTSTTFACAIDNINSGTASMFDVMLHHGWPYIIGFLILAGAWLFGRRIISHFR